MELIPAGTGPSAYREFPAPTTSYETFLTENPAIGYLKVEASRAQRAIPIPDMRIVVMQEFNGLRVLFFDGQTDENGMIQSIELPAPPRAATLHPSDGYRGAVYQVFALHPKFEPQHYLVQIFEGITAILPVRPELKGGI